MSLCVCVYTIIYVNTICRMDTRKIHPPFFFFWMFHNCGKWELSLSSACPKT